ncbi:putative molybdenum cofactor guanylyltransferase [Meiothermus luteus]|uniref:Putative molybdenum cofactor guanylyltransferase n=1 Tax=Meiothermus luteus TaxID=2026184 RepID=A0A399EPN5_9DEIN|nr:putative molybdenum cofactor guanylyltransferase [Meiothermus luteus]
MPIWSGAVLAGGHSSRFGQDKALYPYRGRPLLAWVWEAMAEAEERFVVANRPYPGFTVYPDLRKGGDTLSGLHSALAHARCPWVAVAACDQPFLTAEFWRFLLERVQPHLQAVVIGLEGALEPLGALYHKSLEAEALRRLEGGLLRLQDLIQSVPHLVLDKREVEARFGPRLFLNANRQSDLP